MVKRITDKQIYANEWNIDPKFIRYDKRRDSYYDARDGRWLDGRCRDPECGFCKGRPLRAKIP